SKGAAFLVATRVCRRVARPRRRQPTNVVLYPASERRSFPACWEATGAQAFGVWLSLAGGNQECRPLAGTERRSFPACWEATEAQAFGVWLSLAGGNQECRPLAGTERRS